MSANAQQNFEESYAQVNEPRDDLNLYDTNDSLSQILDPLTQIDKTDDILLNLERRVVDERVSPNILDFDTSLVVDILAILEKQFKEMKLEKAKQKNGFEAIFLEAEIERIRFLIRLYLRSRLDKIERYFLALYRELSSYQSLLADFERKYLEEYHEITIQYLKSCQPEGVPDSLRELDDTDNIPVKPDLTLGVFFRSLVEIRSLPLDDGTTVDLLPGNIFFLSYSAVEHLLNRGQIELL